MQIKFYRRTLMFTLTSQSMNRLVGRLSSWQVAFALVLSTLVSPALAQVDSWVVANCPGFKQPPLSTMVELCNGHEACSVVVSSYDACPRVQKLLETLDASMSPAPSGFAGMFSKRQITPGALWRANVASMFLPADFEEVSKSLLDRIDQLLPLNAAPVRQFTRPGSGSSGKIVVYLFETSDALKAEGGTASAASGDVIQGPAMTFYSSGQMRRAYHINDAPALAIDVVVPQLGGARSSLVLPAGATSGSAVLRFIRGTSVFVGQGVLRGNPAPLSGTRTFPDGRRFEGRFDPVGTGLVEGKQLRADGTLASEGTYANFELSAGNLYDPTGTRVIESVDKVKAQAVAAAAARELVERQRREQEIAKAAQEAQERMAQAKQEAAKAAQEAQYKSTLANSNAGQLFALAEQFAASGDAAKAREARLALISRFPNHPMAATAAQQMAGGANAAATGTNRTLPSGPTALATNAPGVGSGPACTVNEGLVQRYIPLLLDFSRQRAIQTLPTDQIPKVMSDSVKRIPTDELPDLINKIRARQANPKYPVPHYELLDRIQLDLYECEMKRRAGGVQAASAVAPANIVSSNGNTSCASTPQESFRRFENDLRSFDKQFPNSPPTSSTGSGARAQNQYALFYGTRGLGILETYRSCLSPADYETNKKLFEGMRDNGRTGCEKLSTSPGSCTATYPAGWPSR